MDHETNHWQSISKGTFLIKTKHVDWDPTGSFASLVPWFLTFLFVSIWEKTLAKLKRYININQ